MVLEVEEYQIIDKTYAYSLDHEVYLDSPYISLDPTLLFNRDYDFLGTSGWARLVLWI